MFLQRFQSMRCVFFLERCHILSFLVKEFLAVLDFWQVKFRKFEILLTSGFSFAIITRQALLSAIARQTFLINTKTNLDFAPFFEI